MKYFAATLTLCSSIAYANPPAVHDSDAATIVVKPARAKRSTAKTADGAAPVTTTDDLIADSDKAVFYTWSLLSPQPLVPTTNNGAYTVPNYDGGVQNTQAYIYFTPPPRYWMHDKRTQADYSKLPERYNKIEDNLNIILNNANAIAKDTKISAEKKHDYFLELRASIRTYLPDYDRNAFIFEQLPIMSLGGSQVDTAKKIMALADENLK